MKASLTKPRMGLALLLSPASSPRVDPFLTPLICGLLLAPPSTAFTELREPLREPIKDPLTMGLAVFSSSAKNLFISQLPSPSLWCLSGLLTFCLCLSGLEVLRALSGLAERFLDFLRSSSRLERLLGLRDFRDLSCASALRFLSGLRLRW